MKTILFILMCFAVCLFADDYTASTLTKEGEMAPKFSVTTIDGKIFTNKSLKGKVILLNFFATWCGPCMAELPEVEEKIWQKYKDEGLIVLAVGREHSIKELAEFNGKKNFTFHIAQDPKRKNYARFATQYIPRTYLIDRDGTIVYQSIGYTKKEFQKLIEKIQEVL
jgi:peroxiredoxin